MNIIPWKIWIAGYGTFDFEGTEREAEAMRRHKSQCEHSPGRKWRASLSTDVDRLTAQIVDIWDRGEGVPQSLMSRLHKAKQDTGADYGHTSTSISARD